jgi:hypothetical protein
MPPVSEAQRVLEGYAAALGLALAYLMHIAEHPDEPARSSRSRPSTGWQAAPQACALLAERRSLMRHSRSHDAIERVRSIINGAAFVAQSIKAALAPPEEPEDYLRVRAATITGRELVLVLIFAALMTALAIAALAGRPA